jgi:hypothetical protein
MIAHVKILRGFVFSAEKRERSAPFISIHVDHNIHLYFSACGREIEAASNISVVETYA